MSDIEDPDAEEVEVSDGPDSGDESEEPNSDDGEVDEDDSVDVRAAFDWPGPAWSAGHPDGAHQAPLREVVVKDEDRITPSTLSVNEVARLVALEAVHDRTSDDAIRGAMQRVYDAKTAFTIRRAVKRVPAVYGPDGKLVSEGEIWIEVWRVGELHNPHPPPIDL
jgi:hypothetical protein